MWPYWPPNNKSLKVSVKREEIILVLEEASVKNGGRRQNFRKWLREQKGGQPRFFEKIVGGNPSTMTPWVLLPLNQYEILIPVTHTKKPPNKQMPCLCQRRSCLSHENFSEFNLMLFLFAFIPFYDKYFVTTNSDMFIFVSVDQNGYSTKKRYIFIKNYLHFFCQS